MARRKGQIPLYEAINKAGSKSKKKTILERLRPKKTVEITPESAKYAEPVISVQAAKPTQHKQPKKDKRPLWNKPKLFQIIDGRVEISISYLLAIAILLGIILMLLVAFRLGKLHERGRSGATTLSGSVYRNNRSVSSSAGI